MEPVFFYGKFFLFLKKYFFVFITSTQPIFPHFSNQRSLFGVHLIQTFLSAKSSKTSLPSIALNQMILAWLAEARYKFAQNAEQRRYLRNDVIFMRYRVHKLFAKSKHKQIWRLHVKTKYA